MPLDDLHLSLSLSLSLKSVVATALGVRDNKVVSRVKRLGGGFGGKESRCCINAAVCAVAARK